MKPEAGQLTVNELIAIGKAASFLRFEAAFKTHATDVARKEWRSVADALTDIECRCQPQPAEEPDEWVIQDKVPVRPGTDQICWNEKLFDAQTPFGFIETCCGSQSDGKMHGYGADGCFLSVRCRRRDLPKVEPQQCAACDAPAEPGTVGCKDCNEYATAICSPEPQPQKTRVRLWKFCGSETVVASTIEKTGDWQEIHHDAEGFYVEG